MNNIIGRNAVIEALKSERQVSKLTIANGAEGSIKKIVAIAREKNIPIDFKDRNIIDKMAENGVHQGVIAQVSEYTYCEVEDILDKAKAKGEAPFVIILDGLEDPHNLGAIMRTADCAGAHGIIIPKRRAVDITKTVVKASAGAVEHVLCAKVSSIANTIEKLKDHGLWIGACDMNDVSYTKQDLTGNIALVVGGEGIGVSKLVKEKSDFVLSIPMKGEITSLNASNAAAILMYEVVRQRDGK
ncbi:MAG: 23S rRNA (guanosine(2251)-2'-O)-methyltransferase RlmB [Anaerovoracaceae bacterium]